MIPKPVEVRALVGFRIWLRYEDGTQGEIDLSDIAGHGVFAAWNDPRFFGRFALDLTARSNGATSSTSVQMQCICD